MTEFTVCRTLDTHPALRYCLLLDDMRIAGGKPDYRGDNILISWRTKETYGPVDAIKTENGQLATEKAALERRIDELCAEVERLRQELAIRESSEQEKVIDYLGKECADWEDKYLALAGENAKLRELAVLQSVIFKHMSTCPTTDCQVCPVEEECAESVHLEGLLGIDDKETSWLVQWRSEDAADVRAENAKLRELMYERAHVYAIQNMTEDELRIATTNVMEDNAKLREQVEYMTPIALYAASEQERDRMRELGVEL